MNDINQVILSGRLGKEPIEKVLDSGKSYVWFNLAVSESYKPKSGDWVNNTHWVHCKCWSSWIKDKALELNTGDYVVIAGKINVYQKDKQTSITSINVNKIIYLESQKEVTEDEIPEGTPSQNAGVDRDDEEELPF